MGKQTLSSLKNTNRTFDNVLDSFLNLTDGGTVASAVEVTGGITSTSSTTTGLKQGAFLVPCIPNVTFQDLSGAGAANVTAYHTRWTTTGAQALTLAAGTELGQLKKITLVVDGGNGTLTIADPVSASLDVVTFADAGDQIELIWNGTAWRIFAMEGSVDAGPSVA